MPGSVRIPNSSREQGAGLSGRLRAEMIDALVQVAECGPPKLIGAD